MSEFFRKFWSQILLVTAAVVGFLAMAIARSRDLAAEKARRPPRPALPDVKVPEVDTSPSDGYKAGKGPATTDAGAVVDELNARHR